MATKAIITDYGRSQIAQALADESKIPVKYIVYGNGGGAPYEPSAGQTDLKDPAWKTQKLENIQKYSEGAWVYYGATIPTDISDITIREIGIVDESMNLLIIASVPDTELVTSRGGVLQRLPMRLGVTTSIGDVLIVEAPSNIPLFTQDSPGLIKGSTNDGYVYREDIDDGGFGRVYGWENLFKKQSYEPQFVDSVVVYAPETVHYVQGVDGTNRILWEMQNDAINLGNPDTVLHLNTALNGLTEDDHIVVTTPLGEKVIAYLGDMPKAYSGITHYAFNSGSVSATGTPDYAYIRDYSFGIKRGTRFTGSSQTLELTDTIYVTISKEDMTEYNVFIDQDPDTEGFFIRYLDNTMFRQPQKPAAPEIGDYWLRTLEPLQAYWYSINDIGEPAWIPTDAVFAFKLGRGEYGMQYITYEGEIEADTDTQTLVLPPDYSVVQPDNFHWSILDEGTMDAEGLTTYKIGTVSEGLVAKMPDYAWNGYNVNMRTLSSSEVRLLPDPSGHDGQLLMSNGEYAYWTTIRALLENSLANAIYIERT